MPYETQRRGEAARLRLLTLLCAGDRTTGELAAELGMSANGARGHLELLEEEGLVEYRVVRRGVGKPAHEYRLTAAGSLRMSRAYLPLLRGLLAEIMERDGADAGQALLRRVGRRLGEQRVRAEGDVRERTEAAAGMLRDLGGGCSIREEDSTLVIEGACCPLRALVPDQPMICTAIEALLEEFTGIPVREHCQKTDPVACRFHVGAAAVPPS